MATKPILSPSSSLAKSTSSKPISKKKTRAEQEEEEERIARESAAAAAALAAIPPSPFDRIEEVWALDGKFEAQRAKFEIEDGPGICIQALTLDDVYAHLHFARSIGLNNDQAKVFFGIMDNLTSSLVDPNLTKEVAFSSFKDALMANSTVQRGSSTASTVTPLKDSVPVIPIPSSPSTTTRNSTRPPSSSKGGLDRPSSRGKESGSTLSSSRVSKDGKSGTVTPRSVVDDSLNLPSPSPSSQQPPPPTVPLIKTFSIDMIKQIVSYAARTFFQHFQLYRAVFNSAYFRPRKNLLIERLLLETVVPLSETQFQLDQAVELTSSSLDESKRKEQADIDASHSIDIWSNGGAASDATRPGTAQPPSQPQDDLEESLPQDDLSILVHQHMRKARLDLQEMLNENERQFDLKLKNVETKLGGGGGSNPSSALPTSSSLSNGANRSTSIKKK